MNRFALRWSWLLFLVVLLVAACGTNDDTSSGTSAGGAPPGVGAGGAGAGAAGSSGASASGASGAGDAGSVGVGPTIDGVTLQAHTKVLDQAAKSALTSYDAQSGKLAFSSASPLLEGLAVGDVLLSGGPVGNVAPFGFMRKVVAVSKQGSTVTLSTTQATLKDAIADAKVNATRHYADATGVGFLAASPGVSLMPNGDPKTAQATHNDPRRGTLRDDSPIGPAPSGGITLALNNVKLQYPSDASGGSGGGGSGSSGSAGGDDPGGASAQVQVTINGWVNISPDVFLDLDVEGCGFLCWYVHEFDAGVRLDQSSDVKADVEFSASYDYKVKVAEITLPGFATGPLYWSPKLDVYVGVSVTGKLTVTLHAHDQVHLQAGARWDDDNAGHHAWTSLNDASATGAFDVPNIQVELTAKAYAKAELSILLFDVVGPEASLELGLVFDIASPRHPFLKFGFALTGDVGVKVSAFGFWEIDWSVALPEADIPIAQTSNIAPFLVGLAPGDGASVAADQLVFQATAYDLEDGTHLTYRWTDESGTVIGTSASFSAPATLAPGVHTITAAVTDTDGATTTGVIHDLTVLPAAPPSITINSPTPGEAVISGLAIGLGATVNDGQGIAVCGASNWSFSWVDQTTGASLGTGCNASATLTDSGAHAIVFSASGPLGAHASASVDVDVTVPVALTASISQPSEASVLTYDIYACLPQPALAVVGGAAGGTGPYSYAWSVWTLNPDGSVHAGPVAFATGPSTTTASFPSNWESMLDASASSTGEAIVIGLTATDAVGNQVQASDTITWLCGPG